VIDPPVGAASSPRCRGGRESTKSRRGRRSHKDFGQHTTLKLSGLVRNPAIAPSRFTFTPPKGADIIGE
jgi:outer membrane lipoprotein-sorting protein